MRLRATVFGVFCFGLMVVPPGTGALAAVTAPRRIRSHRRRNLGSEHAESPRQEPVGFPTVQSGSRHAAVGHDHDAVHCVERGVDDVHDALNDYPEDVASQLDHTGDDVYAGRTFRQLAAVVDGFGPGGDLYGDVRRAARSETLPQTFLQQNLAIASCLAQAEALSNGQSAETVRSELQRQGVPAAQLEKLVPAQDRPRQSPEHHRALPAA